MNSDLEDLKRQATEDYLRRRGVDVAAARTNNTVCPVCGKGSRTGCFHYYPDTFRVKCFSCGFSGDMFDLIAQERGIDNDTYMARYRTHADEEGAETMRPYPGIPEMLRAVVKNGGKNYLYTHRGLNAWEFLRNDGLDTLFCDGVTNKDGFPAKPAPDALNFLAEKHHLNKSECIMMGDRDIDLDAGKNAGMACALFDPEDFYPDYDTPYRYRDADTMRRELAGE